MADVNYWLLALAFLLGVVLTLALTVRRVEAGVAVSPPAAEGDTGEGAEAGEAGEAGEGEAGEAGA